MGFDREHSTIPRAKVQFLPFGGVGENVRIRRLVERTDVEPACRQKRRKFVSQRGYHIVIKGP
jgi:hypothetical protein